MSHAEVDSELEEILMEAAIDEAREFKRFDIGDSDVSQALDSPAGIQSTTDDKVIVYHTETHDAREIPKVYLRNTLRKRLRDGKRAFSLRPTGIPVVGDILCYLHPDHPDRAKWTEMGILDVCHGATFASVVDMEAQMKNRHSRAWERMKEVLERKEREEDRQYNRTLLSRVTGGRAYLCPDCDEEFSGPLELKSHMATHDATEDDPLVPCEECGRSFRAAGLAIHKGREHR